MHSLALCEWTTIRGTSATTPVNQGEDQWLNVSEFLDLVIWVDCREAFSTPTLSIQTAPTKDDSYFKNIITPITLAPANGPTAYTALASSALVPVAGWLRWQLSSAAATWDATMRIWVSGNSPGR
jgi:hypothetical protein